MIGMTIFYWPVSFLWMRRAYRTFMENRTRRVIGHAPWQLSADGSKWETTEPKQKSVPSVRPEIDDNRLRFSARNREDYQYYEDQPLYLSMSFIGLDGKEQIKITSGDQVNPALLDITQPENTWCGMEDYYARSRNLKPGEIDVGRVLGAAVPTNLIGTYTPNRAEQQGVEYQPEAQGYAGKENPLGKRFQGLVRWTTPVTREGAVIGYVSLALDHTHLMEFTDHLIPTPERYRDISDAGSGNYAFMWDHKGRNISHPRDYFIVGCDPDRGEMVAPWMAADRFEAWQSSGLTITDFMAEEPIYRDQSLERKPALAQIPRGEMALDCRYLNFAPQCSGWHNLTREGGSGSFVIFWSGLWKLTTAATIPLLYRSV